MIGLLSWSSGHSLLNGQYIQQLKAMLGWELEKLLTMTMEAMKATEDTINAECESL